MSDEPEYTLTFGKQDEARAALKEIRGTRHSWRREHLLVELGKIVVYIAPVLLLFTGVIDRESAIMFVVGVFAWRGCEKYFLPMITRLAWPDRAAFRNIPGQLLIDHRGVTAVAPDITVQHSWQSVSGVERYDRGVLIRIGPQWVYPFPTSRLPEGVHLDDFLRRIASWREAAS